MNEEYGANCILVKITIVHKIVSVVKFREYNTKAENFRDRVEVGILIDF